MDRAVCLRGAPEDTFSLQCCLCLRILLLQGGHLGPPVLCVVTRVGRLGLHQRDGMLHGCLRLALDLQHVLLAHSWLLTKGAGLGFSC